MAARREAVRTIKTAIFRCAVSNDAENAPGPLLHGNRDLGRSEYLPASFRQVQDGGVRGCTAWHWLDSSPPPRMPCRGGAQRALHQSPRSQEVDAKEPRLDVRIRPRPSENVILSGLLEIRRHRARAPAPLVVSARRQRASAAPFSELRHPHAGHRALVQCSGILAASLTWLTMRFAGCQIVNFTWSGSTFSGLQTGRGMRLNSGGTFASRHAAC